MTKDDALRMMLGPFKAWRDVPGNEDVVEELTKIINAVEKVLAQETALQALHNENERLGLYRDAYAEQEPVAHWSDCAVHSEPAYPKGKCDCGGYTHSPQRTWVGLKEEDYVLVNQLCINLTQAAEFVDRLLKERNNA